MAESPLKRSSRRSPPTEYHERMNALLSIASMSGGCQVIYIASSQLLLTILALASTLSKGLMISHHRSVIVMRISTSSTFLLDFRLPFHLENMKTLQFLYHLLHRMELINSCLIRSWICILLFKKKSALFPVPLYCQIPMVAWMLLNFLKKRSISLRVIYCFSYCLKFVLVFLVILTLR